MQQPASSGSRALPRQGVLLLAALSFFWGVNWPVMKVVLNELPPLTFRTFCLVLGGLGMLVLTRLSGTRLSLPGEDVKAVIFVTLFNIIGWHLCSAYGIMRMQASRAVIIAFTMPLWAMLLSNLLLKERITRLRAAALALGLTGLTLLIWPDIRAVGTAPLGTLFMLGAAVSWAAGTVLMKFFKWHVPTTLLLGWQMLFGSIPVLAGALALEPMTAVFHLSAKAILAMIYIILVPMLFCYWAFFTVVRLYSASIAALGTLSIPVIGVLSSRLMLHELVGFHEITALVLVLISLALVMLRGMET
jgi:drug/metabolite transporter (DMT)-like permease